MIEYSCKTPRDDFDATRFCKLLSDALLQDLNQDVASDALLEELKQDIDSLELDEKRFALSGSYYTELNNVCRVPLAIAMLTLVPLVDRLTERFGVVVDFDEEHLVQYPHILKLRGQAASEILELCLIVESDNRIIGGMIPFEEMLKRAEDIDPIERQRLLNKSHTGRHLMAVSD